MKLLEITREEDRDIISRMRLWKMPDVTEHQANMMLHAIGADNKGYRSYLGGKYYHAYRNYFDAGGTDAEEWDDLVKKGYAEKRRMYHVTDLGLDLLETLTGKSTIYGNYHNYADCRGAVLTRFLSADVYCGYGCWYPTSAKTVSEVLHIPLKLVRDACRRLVEEGFLIKGHEGGMDEDGCIHCYHGYFITKKARGLDEWKALYEKEMKYISRMGRDA